MYALLDVIQEIINHSHIHQQLVRPAVPGQDNKIHLISKQRIFSGPQSIKKVQWNNRKKSKKVKSNQSFPKTD